MRYTFESFLCGIPVRNYIYQKEERGIRIERAGKRGYWSKQALLGGIDLDVTPLYKRFHPIWFRNVRSVVGPWI